MLAIIFFLLKIIGLILKIIGVLLLLILFLVALIALVPIRYRFGAFVPEKKKESGVHVKVSWFGFLLVIKGEYRAGTLEYLVKIFGHQILGNQPEFIEAQKEKKKKKKEKARKKKQKKKASKGKKRRKVKETKQENDKMIPKEKEEEKKLPAVKTEVPKEEEVKPEKVPKTKPEPEKTSRKTKEVEDEDDWEEEEEKDSSEGRISQIKNLVHKGKEKWEEYHMSENLPFAKKILWKTVRHVMPRKLKGQLVIGLEAPEWMGYVTAGMAMLYPAYGRHFSFTPVFGESRFEADCEGCGRIRIGFFVYIGIRLLLNKDVRKLIFG